MLFVDLTSELMAQILVELYSIEVVLRRQGRHSMSRIVRSERREDLYGLGLLNRGLDILETPR